ncbi:MAG: DUF2851 family protein [Planctomycetes bacterium]|nr:DUF2851 family protein [Planctomycetota bacterium]
MKIKARQIALNEYEQIKNSAGLTSIIPSVIRDRPKVRFGQKINEKLIQYFWAEQVLQNVTCRTVSGQSLQVIFPGFWNLSGGPDFKQARLKIGPQVMTGDVEIHCAASDWYRHRHQTDRGYQRVILHVVFWNDLKEKFITNVFGQSIPQLVLSPWWRRKYEAFDRLLTTDMFYPTGAQFGGVGRCYQYFLDARKRAKLKYFIDLAGRVRLDRKIKKFRETLSQEWVNDSENALYRGLLETLGYKNNRASFLELARRMPVRTLRVISDRFPETLKPLVIQAILLKTSGLWPAPGRSRTVETRRYLANLNLVLGRLKNNWKKYKQPIQWNLTGTRPINFPVRRIAGFSYFLTRCWLADGLIPEFSGIFMSTNDPVTVNKKIFSLFQSPDNDYWHWHSTFDSKKFKNRTTCIGRDLINIMVVNVILPVLLWQAEKSGSGSLTRKLLSFYTDYPLTADNYLTRFMNFRLLGQNKKMIKTIVTTACQQQGLFQIFNDFCVRGHEGCQTCGFLVWLKSQG